MVTVQNLRPQLWPLLERLNESFYHILVADIRMEEIDKSNTEGMGLLGELEKSGLSEGIKVIMLSAYGTPEQMREAYIDHRVADFLTKDEFSRAIIFEEYRKDIF